MSIAHDIRLQPSYSRWLTEEVFNLIDLVRSDEAIYNPRHKYYFCRPYVENFWREIDLRLMKNSGASLAKWTNLRISFRREYANFQEEKVPPCWTYFDKMLFLHPYLRNKKQSEPKGIDAHLQEALAQINGLNYKIHQNASESPVNEYMDQYLTYCEDDPQPSPGIEDIIEEDVNQSSNCNTNSIPNDIQSDCENENRKNPQDNDEFKDIIVEISDDQQSTTVSTELSQFSQHNDFVQRCLLKRQCSEMNDINASALSPHDIKSECENESENKDNAQENDDFKEIIVEISDDHHQTNHITTEVNQLSPHNEFINRSLLKRARTELSNANSSIISPSTNNISMVRPLTTFTHQSHQPSEMNAFHNAVVNSASAHLSSVAREQDRRSELCDCKTDPDAMFLMSLLPDIRKLNGRDRGKIKIAFQNIVQEFLYPD